VTQSEEDLKLMEDVEEVGKLDDTYLHWRAKLNSNEWNGMLKSGNKFRTG
jgi:hypothetical protein